MDLNLEVLAGMPALVGIVATVIAMIMFKRTTVAIFIGLLAGLATFGLALAH